MSKMIGLNANLDLVFFKFKVAPSHNDSDYFKGFYYEGYEFGKTESESQITKQDKLIKELVEGLNSIAHNGYEDINGRHEIICEQVAQEILSNPELVEYLIQ